MRALLTNSSVEPFNAKDLYSKVLDIFDEYNSKQFAIRSLAEESLTRKQEIREECYQRIKSDPTWKATVKSDKLLDFVNDFDEKINFLKTQFTADEEIIFHYSLEERELDKVIMDKVCKSEHKYYEIKKSCYLKIALCFGLIKLRSNTDSKPVKVVAQSI